MECEYCHRMLASIKSLKKHQLHAKYCLKLRLDTNTDTDTFTCNDCSKIYTSKYRLQRHVCSVKKKLKKTTLEEELVSTTNELEKLQTKFDKISAKYTISQKKAKNFKQIKLKNGELVIQNQKIVMENTVLHEKYRLYEQFNEERHQSHIKELEKKDDSIIILQKSHKQEKDEIHTIYKGKLNEIRKLYERICETKDDITVKEINRLYENVNTLQNKLEGVAVTAVKTSKANIYNIIQKLEPLTDERLIEHSKNLTIEHIKNGVEGYVEYAMNGPFKNSLVCVDYSRKKVVFKNEDGKKVSDPNMDQLSKRFFQSINDRNTELTYKYIDDITKNASDDCKNQLRMDVMNRLGDVYSTVGGVPNTLNSTFISKVCNRAIPPE
jgi:hypothetical protein